MVRLVACCFLLSVAAIKAEAQPQQTKAVTNNNNAGRTYYAKRSVTGSGGNMQTGG